MDDPLRVFAGDCTTDFEGADRAARQRGRAIVLVKPDDTVLVHDADGYQPVAWLTRPAALTVERPDRTDPDDGAGAAVRLVARDGDQRLRVVVRSLDGDHRYPVGEAGVPVADGYVRSRGAVLALGGDAPERYPLPAGATVLDESCDCGKPRIRVERGIAAEVCVDRSCDPLDDAVRAALDREFDCPDCGCDLRVLRRGGLVLGCEASPDCETAFPVPEGTVDGTCACGLPAFSVGDGRRCLDAGCDRIRG